jgi:alkanesulfonate monooxygenase SsuD/methylene tetrahydromethanopterin reductase-like flavin-dependent oxidoreductase (luciferase family)
MTVASRHSPHDPISVGVLLWSQGTDWPSFRRAAEQADRLGYAHLWTWDHLLPIFGDMRQPIFEGWTALGALAALTHDAHVGLLVGANTFRNPAIVAKAAATIDHISGGRSILGLGGAWFEPEHEAYGVDFGSGVGQRLGWLDEAAGLARALLDGNETTHAGPRYQTNGLKLTPTPQQGRIPIMIGGVGERRTLQTVARYADMWNAYGGPELLRHKVRVLRDHCDRLDRDPATIEFSVACKPFIRDSEHEARALLRHAMDTNRTPMRAIADDDSFWAGTPEQIAERMLEFREAGFGTFIAQVPAPFDIETLERFVGEVKPMVDRA